MLYFLDQVMKQISNRGFQVKSAIEWEKLLMDNDTSYSEEKNEVYITIHSDEEYVHRELADYFTFEVPEAKYLKKNPRYKYWDGTIRLYSPATGDLYHGLLDHLQVWAAEKQYIVEYEKNDWYGDISQDNKLVSLPAVKQYMKKIPR